MTGQESNHDGTDLDPETRTRLRYLATAALILLFLFLLTTVGAQVLNPGSSPFFDVILHGVDLHVPN